MHHHHRLPALALSIALLVPFGSGTAASATRAAAFLAPSSGVISVLQTASYTASWTESTAVTITSRTMVVQTARPLGARGCDIRWVPVIVATPIDTSFSVSALPINRCYRFVLVFDTSVGRQTIASSPVIPAPSGMGATAQFTNPFVDGLVAYDTQATIAWVERDTLGSRIVSRSLDWQSAAAVDGSCASVTWSGWSPLAFATPSITQTLARSTCYRYRLTLQDAVSYRSEITSGSLLIAGQLPPWTGMLDLYRPEAFASQADRTLCIAAGTQMMLNLVLGQADTSSSSQLMYIWYAQANDTGSYASGSDPAGWAAALNRYGGAGYTVARFGDPASALKAAAQRMRLTNKPVGVLVWAGRHAWVMSGFDATADPATTNDFTVTAVYVEGPLYPRPVNSAGYDQPPDSQMTPSQLSAYFTKYADGKKAWNGGYILILP